METAGITYRLCHQSRADALANLPSQGGSRKGMRSFGNETGRAMSLSSVKRWRVFLSDNASTSQ
jgi:hypothetical protein